MATQQMEHDFLRVAQEECIHVRPGILHTPGIDVPFSCAFLCFHPFFTFFPPKHWLGIGRVVRYMKRTHSLCVELLQLPLPASSRYPYARCDHGTVGGDVVDAGDRMGAGGDW